MQHVKLRRGPGRGEVDEAHLGVHPALPAVGAVRAAVRATVRAAVRAAVRATVRAIGAVGAVGAVRAIGAVRASGFAVLRVLFGDAGHSEDQRGDEEPGRQSAHRGSSGLEGSSVFDFGLAASDGRGRRTAEDSGVLAADGLAAAPHHALPVHAADRSCAPQGGAPASRRSARLRTSSAHPGTALPRSGAAAAGLGTAPARLGTAPAPRGLLRAIRAGRRGRWRSCRAR